MSMALDLFWRNYLVEIPTAVELSSCMDLGPCFHTISERVVRMGTTIWALMKMMPYSALAADAMILRTILHMMSKMPLVAARNLLDFRGQVGLR